MRKSKTLATRVLLILFRPNTWGRVLCMRKHNSANQYTEDIIESTQQVDCTLHIHAKIQFLSAANLFVVIFLFYFATNRRKRERIVIESAPDDQTNCMQIFVCVFMATLFVLRGFAFRLLQTIYTRRIILFVGFILSFKCRQMFQSYCFMITSTLNHAWQCIV